MNIFVFDSDQDKSAEKLDDARLNKMIVETCQIISTALHLTGSKFIELRDGQYYISGYSIYKPTHQHHPVVKWVAKSRGNYIWTCEYLRSLFAEYLARRLKQHSLYLRFRHIHVVQFVFSNGARTPFVNCARNKEKGVDFTHIEDVHEAYKQYIHARWLTDKRTPKRAGVPIIEHLEIYKALNGEAYE